MATTLEFGIFDWLEHRDNEPLHQIFEQRLQMLEFADENGFYAYHLAEHQGTPLSLNNAPSVVIASAIQRTTRLRLIPTTYCLPWYNPLRLYNEICMLDQYSQGRLEVGIGRGVSPIESTYFGLYDIEASRELYREMLDILLYAFTHDELSYEGKHFQYKGVELYNKPYQKPYPPLWYPTHNIESVPYMAGHGFNTSHNFAPNDVAKKHFELFREQYEVDKDDPNRINAHVAAPRIANTRHIYVGDSDERAVAEARPAFDVWADHISYLSGRFADRPRDSLTLESRMNNETALVGSPDTIRRKIDDMVAETGINYFLGVFNFGNLPQERVIHSLDLFAREVMPAYAGVAAVP